MKKLGMWATLSLIGLIAMTAPRTAAAAQPVSAAAHAPADARDGDPSLIG
jgi:hypothetical protein